MFTLNGVVLPKFEHFGNGDTIVPDLKEIVRPEGNILEFRYEGDRSFWQLALVKAGIDEYSSICSLVMWQMPYDRMDRKVEGKVFTLKPAAKHINSLDFQRVFVVEPHSDVTRALIERITVLMLGQDLLLPVQRLCGATKIAFPDKGARWRYGAGINDAVCFSKERHINEEIRSLEVLSGEVEDGEDVLLVDDICDTGGTFMRAAQRLKEMGAGKVYVFVVHCLPSVLTSELITFVERIYTTSSVIRPKHEKIEEVDWLLSKIYPNT
jgi:ribose-phosphate pyrophosphokinase